MEPQPHTHSASSRQHGHSAAAHRTVGGGHKSRRKGRRGRMNTIFLSFERLWQMPANPPAGMLRCGGQHPRSTKPHRQLPLCSSSSTQGWEGYTSEQASLPKSMGYMLPSPCGWKFGCPWHHPVNVWPEEPCPQLHHTAAARRAWQVQHRHVHKSRQDPCC